MDDLGIPIFLETPTSIQHAPPNRLQKIHPFLKIADGCFFSMAKKVHRPGGGGKCRGGVDLGLCVQSCGRVHSFGW